MSKTFRVLFRETRLKKGYSLRSFCKLVFENPSLVSKMERGVIFPPAHYVVTFWLARLRIQEDSPLWGNLLRLREKALEGPLITKKECEIKISLLSLGIRKPAEAKKAVKALEKLIAKCWAP